MGKKIKKNTGRKKSNSRKKKKQAGRKTIRAATKNAALTKRFFSKVKQEYHDFDYIHQLSEKDKAYLNSFIEEKLNARFNHDGKKLHKTKAQKRAIYTENNARQRDMYSNSKAQGMVIDIDPEKAMDVWQERYINPEFEPIVEETPELLTKQEYLKLKKSGASIPQDMIDFYEQYYFKAA